MGTLAAGPLSQLAIGLARQFGIRHFIETGTFRGQTTRWAAGCFELVTTVEMNEQFHREACTSLASFGNVNVLKGDSAEALRQVVSTLDGPALFWLDAHSGGGFFAAEDYCPLIEELQAINTSPIQHVILIDDARAFVAPPPPPFKPERWPGLSEIVLTLNARHPTYTFCLLDAIVAAPPSSRPLLTQFSAAVRPQI
jgi:hypothetical protein